MRILLIADAYHQHTQNFAKWIKSCDGNNQIDIINTSDKRGPIQENYFGEIYNAYPRFIFHIKGGLRVLGPFFYKKKIRSLKGKYDITNIHFVTSYHSKVLSYLKKKTNHLILTYWGSDFYLASKRNRKWTIPLLESSEAIIADNPELVLELNNYYGKYSEKISFCFFGCAPIDQIKILKDNKISCNQSKKLLKLDPEKISIMIGHNGSTLHQHIEIIKLLESSPLVDLKENIQFLLPITYGGEIEYVKLLKSKVETSIFQFSIFETFMSDVDTAHLRNATDIMVNLQKSDALSGTMKEILYAGNIVINGDWLPYNILKENNIYYHEISSLNYLPEVLLLCIKNIELEKVKSKPNESWAYQSASWEINIKKWYSIFLKVYNNSSKY